MDKRNINILSAVLLAILLVNIEYSGVAIVIPPMANALHLTVSQLDLSASLYLLAFTACIIAGGRLGDIFSSRSVLIIGFAIFALASLLAGSAVNSWGILLGRLFQGLGSALIWPNTTAIAFNCAPPEKKPQIIGIMAGIVGLALAVGPPLAGLIAATIGWRWFFLMNFPLSIAAGICIFSFLPTTKNSAGIKSIDYVGIILLSAALVLLIIAIDNLKLATKVYSLILALSSLVIFCAFYFVEKFSPQPIVDCKFFANHNFLVGCIIRGLVNFAFYVLLFIMGLYLHIGLGYSTLSAGLIFLPMTVLIAICSPISGKAISKHGAINPTIFGVIIATLGYASFMQINSHTATWLLCLLFILPGISYSLTSPGILSITMQSIAKEKTGFASGVFYMMSVLGSLLGIAIAGVILNHYHTANMQQILLAALPTIMLMCITVSCLSLLVLLWYVFERNNTLFY